MLKKIYQSQYTNRHTLRRIRIVLQSLSGFSFSVSPRLLQLELCFCSSQHTHTPSLSNLSWGGEGENTHPHSCMHATYTETHRHTHTRHTHTYTHKSGLSLVFWCHFFLKMSDERHIYPWHKTFSVTGRVIKNFDDKVHKTYFAVIEKGTCTCIKRQRTVRYDELPSKGQR